MEETRFIIKILDKAISEEHDKLTAARKESGVVIKRWIKLTTEAIGDPELWEKVAAENITTFYRIQWKNLIDIARSGYIFPLHVEVGTHRLEHRNSVECKKLEDRHSSLSMEIEHLEKGIEACNRVRDKVIAEINKQGVHCTAS